MLQPLPRLLNKKEAKYTQRVLSNFNHTCVVEIKYTAASTLPVSKIAPHQLAALKKVQGGETAFKYKIPDLGRQNPFDAIIFKEVPAYIAIVFDGGKVLGILNPNKVPEKGSIKKEDCFCLLEKW